MTTAYANGRHSFRIHPYEQPDVSQRFRRAFHLYMRPRIRATLNDAAELFPEGWMQRLTFRVGRWCSRRLFIFPNLVILCWFMLVWWGERLVFTERIRACDWDLWESWPGYATPHHVIFIADPQLVDPHTYPDRPGPLSALTIRYTDLYLRRCHSLLQRRHRPDTVFMLGDLFDGGREWATSRSKSPEERYHVYGQNFWLDEYDRFRKIFFDHFNDGGAQAGPGQMGRRLIASLPGNHDLGIGTGVQLPVRDRFHAMFGDGNRVDVIGNHTFVSIDGLSLSARGQINMRTQEIAENEDREDIWGRTEKFLDSVRETKIRAVDQRLRLMNGRPETPLLKSPLHGTGSSDIAQGEAVPDVSDLPTILLTHVPLYREPDTPCGSLRESKRSILISGGYQYQNVLTPTISKKVIDAIGNVKHVFSGDDHDYCELVHEEYPDSPTEITVKSMSWAMGVRIPGFVMASLWNPVDGRGNSLTRNQFDPSTTIQSHLCLLPDQLSIFIRYIQALAITLVVLFIRSVVETRCGRRSSIDSITDSNDPLLPVSAPHIAQSFDPSMTSAEHEKAYAGYYSTSENNVDSNQNGKPDDRRSRARATSLSTPSNDNATATNTGRMLASRHLNHSSPRSASPNYKLPGYGLVNHAANPNPEFNIYPVLAHTPPRDIFANRLGPLKEKVDTMLPDLDLPQDARGIIALCTTSFRIFRQDLVYIVVVVMMFYFWVIWRG